MGMNTLSVGVGAGVCVGGMTMVPQNGDTGRAPHYRCQSGSLTADVKVARVFDDHFILGVTGRTWLHPLTGDTDVIGSDNYKAIALGGVGLGPVVGYRLLSGGLDLDVLGHIGFGSESVYDRNEQFGGFRWSKKADVFDVGQNVDFDPKLGTNSQHAKLAFFGGVTGQITPFSESAGILSALQAFAGLDVHGSFTTNGGSDLEMDTDTRDPLKSGRRGVVITGSIGLRFQKEF